MTDYSSHMTTPGKVGGGGGGGGDSLAHDNDGAVARGDLNLDESFHDLQDGSVGGRLPFLRPTCVVELPHNGAVGTTLDPRGWGGGGGREEGDMVVTINGDM